MNLTRDTKSSIKSKLEHMVNQLEQSVEDNLELDHLEGELERGGHDRSDEANHALEIGMDITQTSRSAYQLALAKRALQKLGEGTFGYCDDCGETIPPNRLNANPIARRCLDCQTASEQTREEKDRTPSL